MVAGERGNLMTAELPASADGAQAFVAGAPAIPFCLNVGVTGHRLAALGDSATLRPRLHRILLQLRDAAARLHAAKPGLFAPAALAPRLVCPLAEGADQLAADAALELGYELHAILPFRRHHYSEDFASPAALAAFDRLLGRATRVLELPCARGEVPSAYALAGRATVAHCDVLIAVWDGRPARGAGGTAEVVEHALRRGAPVLHVPVDATQPTRLIWSAHEPHLLQTRIDEFAARILDDSGFDPLIDHLLAPPRDPIERAHLTAFQHEHQRRFKPRIEYPLLLAAAGARRMERSAVIAPAYLASGDDDWRAFETTGQPFTAVMHHTVTWRAAYAWSDRLAAHFAQSYRSGHIFNFVAGAVAVLLGLSGLLLPRDKLWLAFTELAVISGFVVNTRIGVAQNWHRRWLDYRQLAERLRPMAILSLVGIAQPDLRPTSRGTPSWVDWYAAGIWRSIGMPSGELSASVRDLTRLIVAEDIDPQVAYHRSSAAVIHQLDHRLHSAGSLLFIASCLSCGVFIAAYFIDHAWTAAHAASFVALSAGLPAIGTAFFGIRVQGDFAGTAARSLVTAEHLAAIGGALTGEPVTLSRTADGTEAAARAMLADLGEWRLSHQQRQLELG